jgi:dTDP-glucose pyrophosphorylase
MKVLILAGEIGTRLCEETEHRPQPIAQIVGRPLLWHSIKIYSHYVHRTQIKGRIRNAEFIVGTEHQTSPPAGERRRFAQGRYR